MRKEYETINNWRKVISPRLWKALTVSVAGDARIPANRTDALNAAFEDH